MKMIVYGSYKVIKLVVYGLWLPYFAISERLSKPQTKIYSNRRDVVISATRKAARGIEKTVVREG